MWSEFTDESVQQHKHNVAGYNRQENVVSRKYKWQVLQIHGEGKTDFYCLQKQDMCTKGATIFHMKTYDPVLTHSVNNHRVMLDLESSL